MFKRRFKKKNHFINLPILRQLPVGLALPAVGDLFNVHSSLSSKIITKKNTVLFSINQNSMFWHYRKTNR